MGVNHIDPSTLVTDEAETQLSPVSTSKHWEPH
jgi:hypothetical protein